MVEDRRAAHPPLPVWRKPNWMVPIIVTVLNGGAMLGVAHVTASTVNPLRSVRRNGGQVLGDQVANTEDVWDLRSGGFAVDRLAMNCAQATNVTVAIRTGTTSVTAVMCPNPAP